MAELFVGWLPLPARYRGAVLIAAVVFVALCAGVGVLFAVAQRPADQGVWDESTHTVDGVAFADPCPLLRTTDAATGEVRTVLLVEEGKVGAARRIAEYDGAAVRLRGTLLHRDGRRMLELLPGDDAIVRLDDGPHAARLRERRTTAAASTTLRGEVIDPKCYLGAMRPGGGKTHKACAALCLRGGIPPMLAVRGGEREEFVLLLDADGRLATDLAIPYVGEPVTITGDEGREEDLRVLRIRTVSR